MRPRRFSLNGLSVTTLNPSSGRTALPTRSASDHTPGVRGATGAAVDEKANARLGALLAGLRKATAGPGAAAA